MKQHNFPIEMGFKYQNEELARWEKLLKPEYFERLKAHVEVENESLTPESTGYDVYRGNDFLNFILNIR